MRQLYMRASDYEVINDIIMARSDEFVEIPPRSKEVDYEWFLAEVKTALLVEDWIKEKSLDRITKKFNVGEGDVHAFADIAEWLMHATSRLAGLIAPEMSTDISNHVALLEKRIHYGASSELIELVSIRGIGRVRARKLYDSGLKTVQAIKSSDIATVSELIGPKTARKLFEELGIASGLRPSGSEESIKSGTMDSLMEREQSTFSDFEK
jgi:helicase